jgi:hypothetical protein
MGAKPTPISWAISPLLIAIVVTVSGMGVLQILVRIAIAQIEIGGRLENLAAFT